MSHIIMMSTSGANYGLLDMFCDLLIGLCGKNTLWSLLLLMSICVVNSVCRALDSGNLGDPSRESPRFRMQVRHRKFSCLWVAHFVTRKKTVYGWSSQKTESQSHNLWDIWRTENDLLNRNVLLKWKDWMQDKGSIKIEFQVLELQLRSVYSVFFHTQTISQILRTEFRCL